MDTMGGIDRRRLAVLLIGAGLLLTGCGGGGGGATGGPGSGASAPATTAAAAAKACLEGGEQAFSFPAAGPTTWVVLGQGRTGVVLGHQAGSDLCEWLPQARRLAKQGHQVLAFDFGPPANIGKDMVAAAAAHALYKTVPGRNKKLVVLDGGGHGTSLVEFGDHAPRVRKLLDQFLAATLGGG